MKRTASATCLNCQTLFENLPVERDGFSAYAVLEVKPCPICAALLCPACDQFHCDGCAETFCSLHLVTVPDGTPKPLHCCPSCAAECEPLPLGFPVQSATEIGGRVKAEVA